MCNVRLGECGKGIGKGAFVGTGRKIPYVPTVPNIALKQLRIDGKNAAS